jgi:uncharacterized membrane protein
VHLDDGCSTLAEENNMVIDISDTLLVVATLLCSLTAGLVFAFAVVVMPGIQSLSDREFLQSFKAMDRVIQENDPLFMLVWLGSALVLIGAVLLNYGTLAGVNRWLLVGAAVMYLGGVQLPTIIVNIPLNNQLQQLELDGLDEVDLRDPRGAFEGRWTRWNAIRTVFACLTSAALMALLLRI